MPTGSDAGIDATNDTGSVCTPNSTASCVGSGGCAGTITCNPAGSGFGQCTCPPVDGGSDGASDGGPARDGGAWTPASLPGLCVWLDAAVGIVTDMSGMVLTWKDKSGQGNDANANPSTPDMLIASAINKHPAVQMDNNPMTINDAPCLHFGLSPFAIAMVASVSAQSSVVLMWDKSSSTAGLTWSIDTSGKVEVTTHTAMVTWSNVDSSYRAYEARGPALTLALDGVVADGGTATDDLSAVGQWVLIGAGTGPLRIAELVAVQGSVSASDDASLLAYFTTKYAL